MTIFYEGQSVEWSDNDVQAEGHIISLGSTSAHVKWTTGPDEGRITFLDLFDIEPVTAKVEDPLHLHAVRKAYDQSQEVGVLNFLASNSYLDTWTKIAKDVLAYAEDRIQVDASMDLPQEQLTAAEVSSVVKSAALSLLRDAFGDLEIG